MKVSDFVKSGIHSTGHIIIADKMIRLEENLIYAGLYDCDINGTYKDNRLVAVTSHRLLLVNGFASPPHKLAYRLNSVVDVGSLSGVMIKSFDLDFGSDKVRISGKGKDIDKLIKGIHDGLNHCAEYPDVEFSESSSAASAPTFISASPPAPTEQALIQKRIRENKATGIACCPKCGSTSLSANKKGFGFGKAVAGVAIAGPAGLVGGALGANKIIVTCLNCGHKFKPGK